MTQGEAERREEGDAKVSAFLSSLSYAATDPALERGRFEKSSRRKMQLARRREHAGGEPSKAPTQEMRKTRKGDSKMRQKLELEPGAPGDETALPVGQGPLTEKRGHARAKRRGAKSSKV